MTREEFWELIDAVRSAAMFDRGALPDALREELLGQDEEAVLEFARHFHDLRIEAYRQELWAAAWIAGGGASEEDFSDFRDWLVTLGREAFEAAVHHSEKILDHADPAELREPFDPDVGRVAAEVYEELTGEPIPTAALRPHPRHPGGRPWRPEDLARRYPKLAEHYRF